MSVKITAISDTHLAQPILPGGDILIHAGDVSYQGRAEELLEFNTWLAKQPYEYKVLIAGNHDFMFEKNPGLAKTLVTAPTHYLENNLVTIKGIKIWGSPITPEFCHWAFNRDRGPQINHYWAQIPEGVDIIVTHGPPMGILDVVEDNPGMYEHVGCKDLLHHIRRVNPKYHIFGHIHEGYGQETKDGTTFINCSIMNEHYQPVNAPVSFEI